MGAHRRGHAPLGGRVDLLERLPQAARGAAVPVGRRCAVPRLLPGLLRRAHAARRPARARYHPERLARRAHRDARRRRRRRGLPHPGGRHRHERHHRRRRDEPRLPARRPAAHRARRRRLRADVLAAGTRLGAHRRRPRALRGRRRRLPLSRRAWHVRRGHVARRDLAGRHGPHRARRLAAAAARDDAPSGHAGPSSPSRCRSC